MLFLLGRLAPFGIASLGILFAIGIVLVNVGARAIARVRAFGEREQRRRCAAVHFGPLANATRGPCTVAGDWRQLTPTTALVVDGEDALFVEHAISLPIPDGPRVFVFGRIEGAVDDPRAVGFRQPARLPRLVVGAHHDVLETLAPPPWHSSLLVAAHLCGFPLVAAGILAIGYGGWLVLLIIALS
ncbi:MAG TPA: hypothetical protein VIA18_16405 [Polyangia bacterium]|jgi:hypothetical protein|nr:hypothetical protein [Polyangia bacterium]